MQNTFRVNRRRFLVGSAAGLGAWFAVGSLRADEGAPSATPRFSFGLIADAQYADVPPAGSRYFRNSLQKATEAVERFDIERVDFVVHLGDLIDRDAASYDTILPVLKKGAAPYRFVLGNHDVALPAEERKRLPERLGMTANYYAFVHKGVRFVVLDGNDVGFLANMKEAGKPTDPANAEDPARFEAAVRMQEAVRQAGRPNIYEWNGGVGPEQLKWLDEQLAEADGASERAVVLCHFPIVPEPMGVNLWNDLEVIACLEKHPSVVAWLCGHHHEGNVARRGAIHYITLRGMVETAEENAYAVADVYDDRIQLRGFGRQPSLELRFDDEGEE